MFSLPHQFYRMCVSFEQVSLQRDNRILISFSSKEFLESFLGLKESLKNYFSSISAWDKGVQSAKHFLWINVVGTPLEFWSLELFKAIGNECGEFFTVSRNTLHRRRLDVASVLVLTYMECISPSLSFSINGQLVNLRISETSILMELMD